MIAPPRRHILIAPPRRHIVSITTTHQKKHRTNLQLQLDTRPNTQEGVWISDLVRHKFSLADLGNAIEKTLDAFWEINERTPRNACLHPEKHVYALREMRACTPRFLGVHPKLSRDAHQHRSAHFAQFSICTLTPGRTFPQFSICALALVGVLSTTTKKQ